MNTGDVLRSLDDRLEAIAERLQRITVRVEGRRSSQGSGVIWRADGGVVTNAHVAHRRVRVTLPDQRVLEGDVVARDPGRDLAAITIEAGDLPAATFGDPAELRVGDLIFALGNPFGISGALTLGVLHAPPSGREASARWLRSDLRLAPGNSGGPLANARGEVVGLNAMLAGGLAFAVPSTIVQRFLQGAAGRPALGIAARPVTVRIPDEGPILAFLVLFLDPDSVAGRAGVLPGDLLTAADGAPFQGTGDLIRAIETARPGGVVRLELLRERRRLALDVPLAPPMASTP